jgi:peptidoglycan hydrolase-like protein with peptidoglycan-binding domain
LGSGGSSGSGASSSSGSGGSSGPGQPLGTFTTLPSDGQVVRQGQVLYSVDGTPVVLLYGSTPAWRSLSQGTSGPDVQQLNADLVALGYTTGAQVGASSDYFGPATATALKNLQADLGVTQSGRLSLGQVVFLPTPARITDVAVSLGDPVTGGEHVLDATSTVRQITVNLDASQQSDLRVGDPVSITLPDNRVTPGVVSSIGRTATAPSSGGEGSSPSGPPAPPTIVVGITPSDPAATGTFDQASVNVAITTATVKSALAVPVAALTTTSAGQPAVDIVASDGTQQLHRVSLGLFDDADGLVEIHGVGLGAGDRVAVPGNGQTR